MHILFLAEAAAGKDRHFYAGNTVLFKAVKAAFEQQFGPFSNDKTFLDFFSAAGCRLGHLCHQSLAGLATKERLHERRKCIGTFAEKLAADPPLMIVVVMKSILPEVMKAIQTAALERAPLVRATPFPVRSEQNKLNCIRAIAAVLKEAVAGGLLTCE